MSENETPEVIDAKVDEQAALVVRQPAVPVGQDAYSRTPEQFKRFLDDERAKRHLLMDYVRNELVAGVDYMLIHRPMGKGERRRECQHEGCAVLRDKEGNLIPCPDCKAKYTLLQPGAEKIVGLLHVRAAFSIDAEMMEAMGLAGKSLAFRCELVSLETGQVLGEGRGAADVGTRGRDINATIKMGKKSALVDAAKGLAGLSSIFTQDLEDMPPVEAEATAAQEAEARGDGDLSGDGEPDDRPTQATVPIPKCPVCAGRMWDNRKDRVADEAAIEAGTRKTKARPAWKCRDKACKGTYWPADWREPDTKQQAKPASAQSPAKPSEPAPPLSSGPPLTLQDAKARMKALLAELKYYGFSNELWKAVLFKHKAKSGDDLNEEQAFDVIATLMNQLGTRKVEAASKETERYLEAATEEEQAAFDKWCRGHGIPRDMWMPNAANADEYLRYVRDMQAKRKEGAQ